LKEDEVVTKNNNKETKTAISLFKVDSSDEFKTDNETKL